jgi:hypothetical protein
MRVFEGPLGCDMSLQLMIRLAGSREGGVVAEDTPRNRALIR